MKLSADIDIDFADRDAACALIQHTPALMRQNGELKRHNSGIYVTPIPADAVLGTASILYEEAEERGYFKLDFLNQSVYQLIKSPAHLQELLATTPPWHRLQEREFVEQLTQINTSYSQIAKLPEPIDSIARMAMFIALIRPGKKHLIGSSWAEIGQKIWDRNVDGYTFRKSHAVAYAHLVAVHMNLLNQRA